MTIWPNLVKTALLGTDRAALPTPIGDGAIETLLSQLNGRSPAQTLLATAATLTLHDQIGQFPTQTQIPSLPTAATADLATCAPQLRRYLIDTIHGRYNPALPELLQALADRQQRIPPEIIPNLLLYGMRQKPLQPLIRQTIGERGHWLAAQNPLWAYAIGAENELGNPDLIWQTGSGAARRLLLQNLRAVDPQRALGLVTSTWAQEGPRDRGEFLRTFDVGLSMTDEPFLETLLDDRSYPVRRMAVGYLSGLAESRLAQRMTARATPLVTLKEGKNGRFLAAQPIAELDSSLQRDGIIGKSSNRGLNSESWRTAQVLGAVPLSVWTERFGLTPAELVKTAVSGFHAATLIRGWSLAASRQKEPAWSEALLFGADINLGTIQMLDLVPYLTITNQEKLTLKLLKDQPSLKTLHQQHPATITLKKMKHIWSEELATVILQRLADDIADDTKGTLLDWRFRESVKRFAYHFPISLHDQARDQLEPAANGRIWQIRIQEFIDILTFRRNMLQAVESKQ